MSSTITWQNRRKGFTLIELLVVVAIIGIIVAIAVPALISAWDRARQKRSMADLRTWGVGLQSYYVDRNFFPFGSDGWVTPTFYVYQVLTSSKDLAPPPYLDGWDNNFFYWSGGNSMFTANSYTIGSFGKGAIPDSTQVARSKCFQCDIRIKNGRFFLRPEGPQGESPNTDCDPAQCR
jgi:type II secretion system protein G